MEKAMYFYIYVFLDYFYLYLNNNSVLLTKCIFTYNVSIN